MSDKIQKKLDQETLSPVLAVFLRFLLVFYGLLDEHRAFDEAFEDSEPKSTGFTDENSLHPIDKAVGTNLTATIREAMIVGEQARTTLGEHLFDESMRQRRAAMEQRLTEREYRERCDGDWSIGDHSDCYIAPIDMRAALNIPDGFRNSALLPTVSAYNPRRPNDLRRFEELPIHEQADEIHIDLGALGTVAIPVPEDAQSLEVDPRTFTIQWTMQDGSVRPMYDLRDYMTSLPRRQMGGFFDWSQVDGYCTPSRRPITGRDTHGRPRQFRDIGHFAFSDGSPVSYGVDRNGRAVMLEQGSEHRHVGPVVVRDADGGLTMSAGDGPCLESAV